MSTYSDNLRLTLIGDGEQSGVWGQTTNTNLGTLLEQAITGVVSIVMLDANYTLTNYNGTTDEARQAVLVVTGINTGIRDVIAPTGVKKSYVVTNSTTGGYSIRIKTTGGAAITVPNGISTTVYCDGTDFYEQKTGTNGNFTVGGALGVVGPVFGTTGSFSGAISSVSPSFTGVPTSTTAAADTNTTQIATTAYVIGQGYLKSSAAASTYAPLASPALTGVPTAPTAAGGTNTTQIATTAFVQAATTALNLGTMATQNANNVTITGGSITGITDLAVADGGTGASTFTSGALLKGNGTAAISAASASDIVTAIGATAVQNATSAASATKATNVEGGTANRIPYNTAPDTTAFITAPSVSDTYLKWTGSAFAWAAASGGGGGTVTSVSGSGGSTGLTLSGGPITSSGTLTIGGTLAIGSGGTNATTASGARTNLGLGDMATQSSSNVSITGGSITGVSGVATLGGTNSWSGANTFNGGLTSSSFNMSSLTSMYGATYSGGQYYAIRFDINNSTTMQFIGSGVTGGNYCYTHFYPYVDNAYYLGGNGQRWKEVWAANGSIQTSDQRLKTNITNSQLGLSFINKLRPVSYKWIIGENVEDGYKEEETVDAQGKVHKSKVPTYKPRAGVRTHYGFLSQEVKSALDQESVGDFAGWVLVNKDDPNSEQCLRYDQFISPLVKAVQELSAQVQTLQAELAVLKGK